MKFATLLLFLGIHAALSVNIRSNSLSASQSSVSDEVDMEEYNRLFGSSDEDSKVVFIADDDEDADRQGRSLAQLSFDTMYGCWCGKGNRCTSVKDAVDGVCRTHDKCYDSKGTANCACERDLCNNMVGAIGSVGATGKATGVLARTIFCNSPCMCDRVCIPWLCCSGWRCRGCKKCAKSLVNNHRTCY